MTLLDVNVLVYAHREGAERHPEYRAWLEQRLDDDSLRPTATTWSRRRYCRTKSGTLFRPSCDGGS